MKILKDPDPFGLKGDRKISSEAVILYKGIPLHLRRVILLTEERHYRVYRNRK